MNTVVFLSRKLKLKNTSIFSFYPILQTTAILSLFIISTCLSRPDHHPKSSWSTNCLQERLNHSPSRASYSIKFLLFMPFFTVSSRICCRLFLLTLPATVFSRTLLVTLFTFTRLKCLRHLTQCSRRFLLVSSTSLYSVNALLVILFKGVLSQII